MSFDRTFEHGGLKFGMDTEQDCDMGPPWEEHDGHGIISEWRAYYRHEHCKKAGERILHRDRNQARFYDIKATIELATKDGWGCDEAALEAKLGRKPTKKEVIAETVEQDFKRMKAWCNDEWCWVGVKVTLLDVDGNRTHETSALWGIESDSPEYHEEVAHELADAIADQYSDVDEISPHVPVYRIREKAKCES